jgi:hypothetical protein
MPKEDLQLTKYRDFFDFKTGLSQLYIVLSTIYAKTTFLLFRIK